MGINIPNFLSSKSKNRKMNDFQDLDHLDGLSISSVSANLYKTNRDDLVMFILEMVLILPLYTPNRKYYLKILNGISIKKQKKYFH